MSPLTFCYQLPVFYLLLSAFLLLLVPYKFLGIIKFCTILILYPVLLVIVSCSSMFIILKQINVYCCQVLSGFVRILFTVVPGAF